MTELAAWYQKKIGTYDKQEWETTIEQRIVQGLRHAPLKSTKLQPDLIDIDLVRGSSFPKAKPVQGLSTIVRLALARVLLFPFWKRWWTLHTSSLATRLFFALWILQVTNTVLYLFAPSSANLDGSCILVPLFLMAGLGVVHAFIVSTAHTHPISHRCSRSLNHDRKRSCLLPSGVEESEIFRSAEILHPPSDLSSGLKSTKLITVVNAFTQTENFDEETEEKENKWNENLQIPTLSLTPPTSQCVKFNLDSVSITRRKSLDDDNSSPILRRRRVNGNIGTARFSAEGDDGFESLNGNNSNGSENGDDYITKKIPVSNTESAKDKVIESNKEKIHSCENVPNVIQYKDKRPKRSLNKINQYDRKFYPFNEKQSDPDFWDNVDCKDNKSYENVSVGSGNTVRFRRGPQLCSDGGSSTNLSGDQGHCESDEWLDFNWLKVKEKHGSRSECRGRKSRKDHITSSSEEECDTASASAPSQHADFAQTTNSEECSYYSEPDESESEGLEGDSAWEPFTILNPASDRVSCTIWENGRFLKTPMSVVEISHAVVRRAELALNRIDGGLWPGTLIAATLAAIPPITRLLQILIESGNDQVTVWDLPVLFVSNSPFQLVCAAFGVTLWERIINLMATFLRLGSGVLIFFLLTVAQRAFNQRFLYAKLFSHLTSARRARQSSLPHFRLNRVRNIKTWLSVRSYLMRRGPQRSVDIIVSAAFILLVLLISFLVIDLLQDQSQGDFSRTAETLGWAVALGAMLLRLVALGTRASRKHRCMPVLLTEQINLHLAMERRPASKDRLSVANNVLKLAADLLKELESPFKISGLSANPYLYTITKVVVLSALSGVLSEILGFKLKLHKIKIK